MRKKRVTLKASTPMELAENFVKIKNLEVTKPQLEQLADLYSHFKKHGESVMKRQAAFKNVVKMIEHGVDTFYTRRLIRSARLGKGITLKKMLVLYSRKGYDIWESYVTAQSITNTFEYKNKKYGMTREEFEEYNKSRAQTEENMILRYGEVVGQSKWAEYVDRQSYAGVTLEYFKEKYGEEEGKVKYEEINQLKSNSINSIMARLGCTKEEAISRRVNMDSSRGFASEVSQEFCWRLYENLLDIHKEKCYFFELNKEFSRWSHKGNRICFYDFAITGDVKVIVEFHGDYFHANPDMYEPGFKGFFFNKNITAQDIWKLDLEKRQTVESHGFKYIVVWESNYKEDPEREIQRCLNEINRA